MTDPQTLLGIDLGTSSVKVVLTDAAGTVLHQATESYAVDRPHPGWAETDPRAWWQAITAAVQRLNGGAGAGQPVGIGLSGQMHGVVLCDDHGAPVRPAVLWCDARAEPQLDLYRSLPAHVHARLRNPLAAGMAGPELAWLHQHEPQVVETARWALQPKDWIRSLLTGRYAAEPSDASATLLYDVITQDWDEVVVSALGIRRELLAPILTDAAATAGSLIEEAADQLESQPGSRLPRARPTPPPPPSAPGCSHPAVPNSPSARASRSSRIVTPPDSSPVSDPVTHLYRDATPTGWYAMAASLTGGQTLDWVRSVLGASWAELYASANREPRADDPIFVPHLVGERTPYLNSGLRGSWTGLGASHDRSALLYSALEGVAFATYDALLALPPGPGPRRR